MTHQKFDWTYFRRRIYINNCTKEDLFLKWATPKGLTEWFIADAEYRDENDRLRDPNEVVQVGDKYRWTFHRGSTITGKVVKVIENYQFSFTFGKNEMDSNEDVIVTLTLYEQDRICYFDIVQENMGTSKHANVNQYISSNMGWMFHMNNLKSIFEAGIDLRVKGEERMHVDAPSGYPLDDYQWTEFRQREYINSDVQKVFKKWTTSKDITEWFIAEAEYYYGDDNVREIDEPIQPDDRYKWTFHQGFIMEGKILKLIENESISFTFGKKEPGSDEDVIVEVNFSAVDSNKTLIDLHQTNIADSEFGRVNFNLSCIIGWSYFLMNLRSLLDFNYDLRDTDKQKAKFSRAYSLERQIETSDE